MKLIVTVVLREFFFINFFHTVVPGACPGGPKGPGPPPLEIEKQKKKKKKVRVHIKLFHLYFAAFLVENIIFSAIFGAGPPPLKKKKKRLSDFGPPPSYEFLDTRLGAVYIKSVCHSKFKILAK